MGEESQGLRVEKGHVFSLLLSAFDRHWRWKASRKNTAHGCHGLALLEGVWRKGGLLAEVENSETWLQRQDLWTRIRARRSRLALAS